MKPSRSWRFVSSCAAKRSPFVGKVPSSSGCSSQDKLTRDFISAICLSRDLGILYGIGMRGKFGKEEGWWVLQDVYAVP